jgi:beta-lactamase regulating signal transducer with metallopeptidase domain
VLLKLCLPPGLTLCTGLGYWVALGWPPQRASEGVGNVQMMAQVMEFSELGPSELSGGLPEPLVPAGPAAPVARPFPWRRAALVVWVAGALAMGALVGLSWVRMRRRVNRGTPVVDPPVLAVLGEAQRALGVKGTVRLVAVDGLRSPLLFGLLRPQIALPTQTLAALSAGELRPVFLHELVHWRRRDLWVNWLQVVLQTVYWFHPLVWLANLRLRAERELIVDDLVLSQLGGTREVYGDSLLRVLQLAARRQWLAPAYVGIVEPQDRIALRLKRILDPGRRLALRLGWPARAAVAALALTLLPQGRPAEEQAGKAVSPPAAAESAPAPLEVAEPVAPDPAVTEQTQKPAVAIPPELARSWQRLDDLAQGQKDLAWQRWEALSVPEKVDLIGRTAAQPPPVPQTRAPLSEEKARGILATYTKDGTDGRPRFQDVAMNLIRPEESQAYAQQRQTIAGEIAALGPDVIPALIDEIGRGGAHTWEARQAFSHLGAQATPALLQAIAETRDDAARCALFTALAGTKDPAARDALTAALDDPFPHTRDAALHGLERLGPVPQEAYLRCLEDDYHTLRAYAVTRLAKTGDAQAIPALQEIARRDPSQGKGGVLHLRRSAREAIEKIAQRTGAAIDLPPPDPDGLERRQPLSFDELAECARSTSPMIRRLAIARMGTSYREPRTVALLAAVFQDDAEPAVRESALAVLRDLARSREAPAGGDATVAKAAAEALARSGGSDAAPVAENRPAGTAEPAPQGDASRVWGAAGGGGKPVQVAIRQRADYVRVRSACGAFGEPWKRSDRGEVRRVLQEAVDAIGRQAQASGAIRLEPTSTVSNESVYFHLLVPIPGDADSPTPSVDAVRKLIAGAKLPAGVTADGDYTEWVDLVVQYPEQYRPRLLEMIAQQVKAAQQSLGAKTRATVTGLQNPVTVSKAGAVDVDIYIKYELSVVVGE